MKFKFPNFLQKKSRRRKLEKLKRIRRPRSMRTGGERGKRGWRKQRIKGRRIIEKGNLQTVTKYPER